MNGFEETEFETLVGAGIVDHRSARIWARLDPLAAHELEIVSAEGRVARFSVAPASAGSDGTGAWTYPDDVIGPDLLPLQRYRVRLWRDGALVAEAAFATAPRSAADAPEHWTFAAMSCNQPFADDGTMQAGGREMFRAAVTSLDENDARFALLMGDQMYADKPTHLSMFDREYFARIGPPGKSSLLDCSREQVRALYQERHRQYWSPPGFRELQARVACYPMLDDHEVVDNFGTHPDHALPTWDALRHGALDAYFDYQGCRVTRPCSDGARPCELDYGFRWGGASFYVLDVRSQRRTRDEITECYTPAQLASLRAFLQEQGEQSLLVLVTTIPMLYLEGKIARIVSAFLSEGSDVHERWSHPQCLAHRNQLLSVLVEHAERHPQQTMLLLGGDVHAAAAYQLELESGACIYQFVSSAISNHESFLHRKASELVSQMYGDVELANGRVLKMSSLEAARPDAAANPYGGLNMGLVDVKTEGGRCTITFRVISYRADGEPVTVFESTPLS